MTNKEIQEMIKKYESKWGRLGHTNIMRPELNHSGEEGGTTMSSMTNDLIAFRQKVAAGREANKLAHKSTVNVTDINRRYFEEITTNGTLIHAGTNQNQDYKYYQKLDLGNGQSRYFYTKAEWDAYQDGLKRTAYDDQKKVNAANKTSGGAKAEADRENAKRNAYENTKSIPAKSENNVLSKFNNMRADVVNEYAKIAREASSKDAAKAFYDMGKGGNEAIDELYSTIQEGFKSGKLSYKDGRFETDDDQLKDDIEAFSDNIQKFAKQIGEASGKGREIQDELEKLMLPDIEAMSKKAEARKDNVKKAQSGREAAEKAGQKAEQNRQAKEKELQENIEKRDQFQNQADKIDKEIKESDKEQESKVKEKENRKKEVIQDYYKNNPDSTSFSEDFNKTVEERGNSDFTVTVHPDGEMVIYSPKLDKQIKELESKYKEVQKFYESDNKKLKNGEYKDEYERRQLESDREYSRLLSLQAEQQIKELENKKQMLAYDEFDSVCRQMGINFDKYNLNEREGKYKSEIKHSSEEPEIMDEYSAFMERVKKGREKNKLAHSIMISPSDLNARYEQSIKDHCFLVHGGNFKYYNKIDLGNGQSRYFYTKAEWDAYQNGLGQQKKADALKKAIAEQKNNMAGYTDWKKEQDTKKQQEETIAKNKAADEAIAKKLQQNSTVIKKQLQEQYEKNKEAAKHEGDRWVKTITEATKVADAPGKDAEIKPEQKQPPVQMEEQVKQEVAQETIPKDTAYTNVLNNVLNDQKINDWAYTCAIRSVYGANEENEKAVWELQAYLDNTLNQIYTEIGSMYGEAAITELDGILANQLQMLYQNYYNQVLNDFTMTANQQAMMNQMMFGY